MNLLVAPVIVIVRVVDNTRRAQFAARTRPGGRPRRRSPRLRSASVSRALSALGMARHARGAAGAWAPRRGNEEERLPLVSDADADARSAPHHPAGVRGDGAASLFSRGGARFAIRAAYAVALLATLSALAFAGWHRGAARVGAVDATGSPFPAVAHEIWLGDAMPEVKRLLFERNKALLEGLGWRVRLWGVDDVTRENFPATYDALRRGLVPSMSEFGPLNFSLWAEIVGGAVVPMVMLMLPEVRKSKWAMLIAASLVAAGVLLNRMNVAVFAMEVKHWQTYVPAFGEIMTSFGTVAGFVLLYMLAVRHLPIHDEPPLEENA